MFHHTLDWWDILWTSGTFFGLVGHTLDWWDIQELDKDMTGRKKEPRHNMDKDGVHLHTRACRCAAVSLCDRFLRENETALDKREKGKRRLLV
jgi:hypothetical protein